MACVVLVVVGVLFTCHFNDLMKDRAFWLPECRLSNQASASYCRIENELNKVYTFQAAVAVVVVTSWCWWRSCFSLLAVQVVYATAALMQMVEGLRILHNQVDQDSKRRKKRRSKNIISVVCDFVQYSWVHHVISQIFLPTSENAKPVFQLAPNFVPY